MTTHTIRKIQIGPNFGGPEVVNLVSAEIPPPARNEVQVDVDYSGFSGSDINMRQGSYPQQKAAPLTPGYCFVGRISVNGPGATRFKVGDLVGAVTVYDSEAEKINCAEKYLVAIPEHVDMREACGALMDWLTAYGLSHRASKIQKGQRVFVHGVSGAVGYALMTFSKLAGAEVYGTASESKHDELRALGVTPFSYKDKKWMDAMKATGGAHIVYDPLGFESWDESWDILIRNEPSILVGFGGNLNIFKEGEKPRSQFPAIIKLLAKNGCLWTRRSTAFYYVDRDRATFMEDLETVMGMLAERKFEVPIKGQWDLEDVRTPHENWTSIPGIGSCLIRVNKNL